MILENSPVQPATMTKKEVQRARKTAEQLKDMTNAGFKTKEITISPAFANFMGLVWALILFIPVALIYYFKFDYIIAPSAPAYINEIAFLAYLLFIPAHEAVHGICMYMFNGHKRDTIEFGLNSGMPYCTCQAPIKKWPYIVVLVMPTLIFGILFSVLALHIGTLTWLLWTFAVIMGGGGDFTIISKLLFRKEKELTVVDHPYKCGYLLLHKEENNKDETDRIINELNTIQEMTANNSQEAKKAAIGFVIGVLIGIVIIVGVFVCYKLGIITLPEFIGPRIIV